MNRLVCDMYPTSVLLMFFFAAIDHKGDEGGGIAVYIPVACFFATYIYTIVSSQFNKKISIIGILMVIPPLASIGHVAFGEAKFDDYIRASMAFFMSACMADSVSRMKCSVTNVFFDAIYKCSLLSIVIGFLIGYFSLGGDLSSARFQILSPMLSVGLSIGLTRLIFNKSIKLVDVVAVFAVVLLVFLSVTRGILISVAVTVFLSICMAYFVPSFYGVRSRVNGIILTCSLGVVGLAVKIDYSSMFERWISRSSVAEEYGFDPTSLTRIAEVDSQINSFTSGPVEFLVGRGIGSSYQWSGNFDVILSRFLSDGDLYGNFTYVGHNFWVYSLYSGGVIFGLILPILIVYLLYKSMSLNIYWARFLVSSDGFGQSVFSCVLFFTYTIFSTIGGNPFITRSGAVSLGFFAGTLLLAFRDIGAVNENN
jgi:hypothetical protein